MRIIRRKHYSSIYIVLVSIRKRKYIKDFNLPQFKFLLSSLWLDFIRLDLRTFENGSSRSLYANAVVIFYVTAGIYMICAERDGQKWL